MMSNRGLAVIFSVAAVSASAQYTATILPTPNGTGRALAAGGNQITGGAFGTGGGPCLWDGPTHQFISLTPAGYDFAEAFGVGGGKQVGYGFANSDARAIMWSGSASSVVELHPQGFLGSVARATDGLSQVGDASVSVNASRASLWQGTAESFVNLHPVSGYMWSIAYGVDGNIQVGTAENVQVMWRGTPESMVELPVPKGFGGGSAVAVSGNQIVGYASFNGAQAMVWNAASLEFVHLGSGFALDTNGTIQVGYTGLPFDSHAKAWFGEPGTELDLHQFLPTNIDSSQALGIDENGTIVGWGEISGVGSVPIVWTPVPEPATVSVLALGALYVVTRKRRRP